MNKRKYFGTIGITAIISVVIAFVTIIVLQISYHNETNSDIEYDLNRIDSLLNEQSHYEELLKEESKPDSSLTGPKARYLKKVLSDINDKILELSPIEEND